MGTDADPGPSPSADTQCSTPNPARRTQVDQRVPTHFLLGVLATVGVFAYAVRLFEIRRSYNLFVDEITYSTIADNFSLGHGPALHGAPFDLHPPAVFALLAGVIRVLGLSGTPPDQLVLDLRPVMALFGAGVVVLAAFVTLQCGAGLVWSLVSAAVIGLDPFEILYDSRVMLEPVAQFFVLGAMAALLFATASRPTRGRKLPAVVWLGGLSAGAAFCSKETFGLVLAVALLSAALLPGTHARRPAFWILGIGAACYLATTVAVWCTSGFAPWWAAHMSGVSRLVGLIQTTGFNASSTKVTLASRLGANAAELAGTYALLVCGGVAALAQVWATKPWRAHPARPAGQRCRLIVAVWSACGCGYLAYATIFGSIEAQMYYIVLAPCALTLLLGLASARRLSRPVLVRSIAAIGVVLLLFDSFNWYQQHSRDNNSYAQFFAWERVNVPAGARIGVTEDIAQFVLADAVIGQWYTVDALQNHRADYVLADSSLVEQGYSQMTSQTLTMLKQQATVAFSASSRQDGTLYFFDIRTLTGETGK